MALVLAWMTFAAGGVYTWVWAPAACALLGLTFVVQPSLTRDRRYRALDLTLIAAVIACVVQMVPIPLEFVRWINPDALAVRRALWLPPVLTAADVPWIPITISPQDTMAAGGILLSAVMTFWICRRLCEEGGTGRLVRAIALIGLIASIAAIAQRAHSIDLLYGLWQPQDSGARPYGAFVNRNHMATWIIMACPVTFGYLLARVPRKPTAGRVSQRIVNALEQLGTIRVWLVVSICVMTLAVLLSASRSGLIGLMIAFALSTMLARRRGTKAVRRWTLFQFMLLALVVMCFANFDVLLHRFDESMMRAQQGRGRVAIWVDTFRLAGDFPVTGTGAGTFGKAISVYQTAEPGYAIDQAHNHYLQVMAEGGASLLLPGVLAAGLFLLLASRSLRHDLSSNYLIRAGACSGIGGVLVQSIWETGLTMPANALLFAILAAIATYSEPAGTAHA